MSRILKRPMFKTGGSPNEGIMHGLVDRRGYSFGERVKQRKSALDEIYSSIPMPTSRFPMGQIGLNLVSGEFAGDGFLSNVGRSVRGPYSEWTKEQDALDRMKYQLDVTKTGQAVADVTAMDMARAKAAGQSGFLKKETTEGAYEHFLEENLKSANELKGYEKPNLNQKYPRQIAEFDSYVSRNLRATTNTQGKEIASNFVDFVPFNVKTQTFDYSTMMPGMYYYDPRYRIFVQRVPDNPETPEDESGYFQYDKFTFSKTKLSGTK
jgi:hypothetical protein